MSMVVWWLYLIRTEQNTLYTGVTTDVARRLQQHTLGQGAKYLLRFKQLTLVYQCAIGDRSTACQLEYAVKQLDAQGKQKIVQNQPDLTQLRQHLDLYR